MKTQKKKNEETRVSNFIDSGWAIEQFCIKRIRSSHWHRKILPFGLIGAVHRLCCRNGDKNNDKKKKTLKSILCITIKIVFSSIINRRERKDYDSWLKVLNNLVNFIFPNGFSSLVFIVCFSFVQVEIYLIMRYLMRLSAYRDSHENTCFYIYFSPFHCE